jgi:hypothetical protein
MDPLEGGVEESKSAHHQCLETSTAIPLGGATGGSGSNHHQCYKTSATGPLAGADGDPKAPTINT